MSSTYNYKFGLKPSKDDSRDRMFCFYDYEKIPLPFKFSLTDIKEIDIFNQGNINSCSSNALSNQIKLSCDDMLITPSRLFTYINARLEDIQEDHRSIYIVDDGASLRNSYKAVMKYNIVDERYYGYYEENVNKFPNKEMYKIASATKRCLLSYRKVIGIEYNLKYILYKLQNPIVIGMCVFEHFTRLTKTNYTIRRPEGCMLGMHAVLIVGYDDIDKTFIVVNSHGREFGDGNGKFKLGYEYALNPDLVFEFLVINS